MLEVGDLASGAPYTNEGAAFAKDATDSPAQTA